VLSSTAVLAGCGQDDDAADDTAATASPPTTPLPTTPLPTTTSPSTTSPSTTSPSTTSPSTAATTTTGPTTTPPPAEPPELRITFPPDGAVFCGAPLYDDPAYEPRCEINGPELAFEGTVSPGAAVSSGPYDADVTDGRWSLLLILNPGPQRATFIARDDTGAEAIASVSVSYFEMEQSDF
jgi:hypothetical protein